MSTTLSRKERDYWDEIPFTFVGAQNNDPTIDDSPLAALVEINHGHYRNSADYEDSVWFCGRAAVHDWARYRLARSSRKKALKLVPITAFTSQRGPVWLAPSAAEHAG